MKLVLDACVLYPTVMREVLLGAAGQGFFTPVWSARLLEEWARAAARRGPLEETQARAEIALTGAAFPKALHDPAPPSMQAQLWLPDLGDVHVLATAITSHADGIVTVNAKDFPRGLLAEEGLTRADPDALLLGFWQSRPEDMEAVADRVHTRARDVSDSPMTLRALMKKARLPRLGKALTQ